MDKILKYATYIGEHEKTIKMLNSQREAFKQALAKMQGKQRPSSKCKIRAAECWGEGNALKLAILRIIVVTTHDPDDQTTSTGKQRPSSKCKIRAAECWGEGNALKLAILRIIVVTTHDPDDQTTSTDWFKASPSLYHCLKELWEQEFREGKRCTCGNLQRWEETVTSANGETISRVDSRHA